MTKKLPEQGPESAPGARTPNMPDMPDLILPGLKPVLELLQEDPKRVDTVFIKKGMRTPESIRMLDLCRLASVRFKLLENKELDHIYAGRHQGVLARLHGIRCTDFDSLLAQSSAAPLPLLLALDQVQDTGNIGTLARSLYALGGAGLLLPRHNSASPGPGALRASAGALHNLPVSIVPNLGRALQQAAQQGFAIYGASCAENSLNALSDLNGGLELHLPALLVLGNEDKGIRPGVAKHCDTLLHIPMLRGFDSLNVAQAGAMLLVCFARAAFAKTKKH